MNGRGELSSKMGDYIGFCDFVIYGEFKGWNLRGYYRYDLEIKMYFMGIWYCGGYFYMKIVLKEIVKSLLVVWFDVVNYVYYFGFVFKDGLESYYKSEKFLGYVDEE